MITSTMIPKKDNSILSMIFTTTIILSLVSSTSAWGKDGHEIIGNIAYRRLTPRTRAIVDKILNVTYDSQEYEGMTPLGAVADWADQIRNQMPWTSPLHYIDIHEDQCPLGCHWDTEKDLIMNGTLNEISDLSHCTFVYDRDCEKDNCVAGSIVTYSTVLFNTTRSLLETDGEGINLRGGARMNQVDDDDITNETVESLKFITHFIGDIHQPLHVSRSGDIGGNAIHVTFAVTSNNPQDDHLRVQSDHKSNLHAVWDSDMIKHFIQSTPKKSQVDYANYLQDLIATTYASDIDSWVLCPDGTDVACTTAWAKESLIDALAWAYRDVDGIELADGGVVGNEYYMTRMPVVGKKLAMGGVRLAAVLEQIFGTEKSEEAKMSMSNMVKYLFDAVL